MSAIQEAMRKAKRERDDGSRIQASLPKSVASSSLPGRKTFGKTWVIVGMLLALGVVGAILYTRGWVDSAHVEKLWKLVPWWKGEDAKGTEPSQTAAVAQTTPAPETPRARLGAQSRSGANAAQGRPAPAGTPPAASRPPQPARPSGGEVSPPVQTARPVLSPPGASATVPSVSAPPVSPAQRTPQGDVPGQPSRPITLQDARSLLAAGDFRAAEAILKALLEKDPASTEAVVALANLYIRDLGEPQKALPLYQQALQRSPDRPSLHVNLGVYYLKAGDRAKAAEHLNRAISLDPTLAEAHYNLACLYAIQGQREEAERNLQKAVQLDPRSARWAQDDPDLALLRTPPAATKN